MYLIGTRLMRILIHGVSCSGKTSFGNRYARERNMLRYVSTLGKTPKDGLHRKFWKKFNFNDYYSKWSCLFWNPVFLFFLKRYFFISFRKNLSQNQENSIQISLTWIRLLSCIYVISKAEFETIINSVNFDEFQFDKVVTLHPPYFAHKQRADHRGHSLYLFDGICLSSQEANELYLEASNIILSKLGESKSLIVEDFESSYQEMCLFFDD
ncbi:MAG: hypothetical protein ACRCXZ_09885 [Patescibacteria group bacterium]